MAETLKPCPYCGGEAVVDRVGYRYSDTGVHAMDAFHVSCRSCGTRTAEYRSEGGAVEAWNRRAERTCRIVSYIDKNPASYGGRVHRCSACGKALPKALFRNGWTVLGYCPRCGARVVSSDGA